MEKIGMVVSGGQGEPEIMKLELRKDCVRMYREKVNNIDAQLFSKERTIELNRAELGGLGFCVKGGIEHHLPILISRIFKDQAADRTGELFVGDEILSVNDTVVEGFSHNEVVQVLKQAGECVRLRVKYFCANSGSLALQRGSSQSPPTTPTSLCDDVFQPEKHWTEVLSIPLLCAYVTRYQPGSQTLKCETAFEVYSMYGQSTGSILCEDNKSAQAWVSSITHNINLLNMQSITLTNKTLQPEQQVHYMCWACLKIASSNSGVPMWKRLFLALKGSFVCLFESPPVKTKDWVKCESMNRFYECNFRVVKSTSSKFQLGEDSRKHCFMIQSATHNTHYLNVDSLQDLLKIESAWYMSTYKAIKLMKTKTYGCKWRNTVSGLTLDLEKGFSLFNSEEKRYVWTYRFSQLKGSSNMNNTLILHFLNSDTKCIETQELECDNLRTVLFAMEAFLCAKIISIDSTFVNIL